MDSFFSARANVRCPYSEYLFLKVQMYNMCDNNHKLQRFKLNLRKDSIHLAVTLTKTLRSAGDITLAISLLLNIIIETTIIDLYQIMQDQKFRSLFSVTMSEQNR